MAGAVHQLRSYSSPATNDAAAPRPRIRTKIVFAVERFEDTLNDIGPLARLHDKELWPQRQWGPLALANRAYLDLEARNQLLVLTARTGSGRLIGYCFDVVLAGSLHYAKTSHAHNDTIFLHPDYRVGKGLSLKKQPGYRFLAFRERELDKRQVERRRIDPKMWRDFGPILKRFGYEPEATIYARIVPKHEQDAED